MANPIIRVILTVVDQFTSQLQQAGDKVSGFGSKLVSVAKAAAALAATAALGKFFKDAVAEGIAAERSMAALGVAVSNTGADMQALSPALEQAVKGIQRVTIYSDDAARDALTRLITVTGDVTGSMDNLALVTDLAAARNIGLSEAADIVGKAMVGNTTQLNRLGYAGVTATEALGSLRAAVTGFAERDATTFGGRLAQLNNLWADFKEAVGLAILGSGAAGTATGKLAGILAGLAAWVERNSGAIGKMVDVLVAVGEVIGRVLVGAFQILRPVLQPVVSMIGTLLEGIGWLAEKGGALLRKVGLDIDVGLGASLKTAGKAMKSLLTETTATEAGMTAAASQGAATRVRLTRDEVAERKKASQELARSLERLSEEVTVKQIQLEQGLTQQQAQEVLRRQRALGTAQETMVRSAADAYARLDRLNLQLAAGFDRELTPAVQRTVTAIQLVERQMDQLPMSSRQLQPVVTSWSDLEPILGSVDRSLQQIGRAAGGVTQELAHSVTQSLQLADALARAATGDPTAIVGAIGTVAGLFSGLFGSAAAERARRIMQANTDAIRAHTNRLGDLLRSQTPLSQVSTIEQTLRAVLERPNLPKVMTEVLRRQLHARGLTMKEFAALAEELGIQAPTAGGLWTHGSLRQVLQAIEATEWTQFGQDFAGQMAFLRAALSTGALGAESEFGALAALASRLGARGIVGALGDVTTPTGRTETLAALRQLVLDLNRGTLGREAFGELTGAQFLDLLQSLIGILADPERTIGAFHVPVGPERVDDLALSLSTAFETAAPNFSEPLLAPLQEQTDLLRTIADTLHEVRAAWRTGPTILAVTPADLEQQLAQQLRWSATARGVPSQG